MTDPRKALIDKLRADFRLVADHRRQSGDWTEDDERQIGESIKASIAAGNPETICMWALQFSDLAHVITTCAMAIRIAEGRIRAQVQRERDEMEAKRTGGAR